MLRLISVSGIALAMVIGFVALSTQMRDEFYIRTQVTEVAKYMKQVAQQELQCDAGTMVPALPAAAEPNSNNADTAAIAAAPPPPRATSDTDSATDAKPDIVASIDYGFTDDDAFEVEAQFTDVKGESGKLRIKAGRKLVMRCNCGGDNGTQTQCQTIASDINKNYVPGKLKPKPES
ncbi:MAG: hypothetical protein PVG89_17210 [Gammaproteobacteria bacterium]|jgi:hypothetical protein